MTLNIFCERWLSSSMSQKTFPAVQDFFPFFDSGVRKAIALNNFNEKSHTFLLFLHVKKNHSKFIEIWYY